MRRTTLGPFEVSRLCLGAMLMGGATPADQARAMVDRFVDSGGNFVDTADVYGDGASERTLAPWLARHRDRVVLATKVRFGVSDPGGEGLSPERIRAACEASLRRLGVDTIDLYQVHAPDRRATERNFRVVDAATEIAERHGRPVAQVALAWLLGVPGVTAPIIGPRTPAQLEDLLGATDLDLEDAERARLSEPAPPPDVSPHRMLRDQIGLPDVPTLRRHRPTTPT